MARPKGARNLPKLTAGHRLTAAGDITLMAKQERQRIFLEFLQESIGEKEACTLSSVPASTLSRWKREEAFNNAYQMLTPIRMKNLEEKMYDVIQWGLDPERYEKTLRYPTLILAALKAGWPEKYAERTGQQYEDTRNKFKEIYAMSDTPLSDTPLPLHAPVPDQDEEWLKKLLEDTVDKE